jgi:Flp pilus assembly protein TadG
MSTLVAPSKDRKAERGVTLVMVALALVVIALLAGLAIDMVALYVARSEAQRAADAGALAGAQQFVLSTFTSGGITQAAVTTLATNSAVAAAEQNKVAGKTLTTANITVPPPDFSRPGNPLLTVQVSKPVPTFFMNIIGLSTLTVATSATAEAYKPGNSAGKGPTFCAQCLKPFLMPNCDPNHLKPANLSCAGGANGNKGGYFVNPDGSLANPGNYPNGVVGEQWTLHTQQMPSHWYEVTLDSQQNKSPNGWQKQVTQCDTSPISCGSQLTLLNGKAVGPNDEAVSCLITYNNGCTHGSAVSTDTVTVNAGGSPPYTITAGTGNPFFSLGTTIQQSASIVTVPLYDGSTVNSGTATVTVVGYMRVFIQGITHNGNDDTITATILDVGSCGTGGSCAANSGTVTGGGQTFIPVRLVQHP